MFQSDLTWTLYYVSFCMPQSMSQTVKHRQTVKPRSPNGRLMVEVHLQPLHAGVTHLHLWISQGHALWILCNSRSILPPNWWSCPAGFNSRLYHFECKVTVGCSRNILADPTPRILVRTGLNGVGKSLDIWLWDKSSACRSSFQHLNMIPPLGSRIISKRRLPHTVDQIFVDQFKSSLPRCYDRFEAASTFIPFRSVSK